MELYYEIVYRTGRIQKVPGALLRLNYPEEAAKNEKIHDAIPYFAAVADDISSQAMFLTQGRDYDRRNER